MLDATMKQLARYFNEAQLAALYKYLAKLADTLQGAYVYCQADGTPEFIVIRFGDGQSKTFRQCHFEGDELEKFRVHDLRHSHASLLANNGVSLFVIQQTLGHSSPTMTMRYSHLCDAALRQAADVAGEVLARAAAGQAREVAVEAV